MSLPPLPPSYLRLVLAPDLRGYLLCAAGAGLVVCAGLFFRGGPLPAAITAVLMAAGLLLGWTAMPGTAVVAVAYLTVFPDGYPSGAFPVEDRRLTGFRAGDLLFVPAIVLYLAAQFRLYALAVRAHPADRGPYRETKFGPPLRPAAGISDAEFQRLFAVVGLIALVGQLAWVWVVRLEPTFTAIPFRLIPSDEAVRQNFATPGVATPAAARFVMFAGLFAVVLLTARFAFWYWRLNRLTPAEARVASTDIAWGEARREMARLETWRAWGKRPKKVSAKPQLPPAEDAPAVKRGPRWWVLFGVFVVLFLGVFVPMRYILPLFN